MLEILKRKGSLLILVVVLLTMLGCSTTVPLSQKFPEAPQQLMDPAPELIPLPENEKTLTDLIENANTNYGQYYDLKAKYQTWQEWYKQQKQIFESVK